jgi:hypothetical protein
MFFRMSTIELVLVLLFVVGGCAAVGTLLGRRRRQRPEPNRESVGVVQGTLLGLVGLLLAFGLTMAVGRYEERRALVVQESNAIRTTFLRAQMLAEPNRTTSLELLEQYADTAIDLADQVPDTGPFNDSMVRIAEIQRELWTVAGDAVRADPSGTAPRLPHRPPRTTGSPARFVSVALLWKQEGSEHRAVHGLDGRAMSNRLAIRGDYSSPTRESTEVPTHHAETRPPRRHSLIASNSAGNLHLPKQTPVTRRSTGPTDTTGEPGLRRDR